MEQVTDPLVTPVDHLRSAIVKDPVMMQMLKADSEEIERLMEHVADVSPELMSQMLDEESPELKDASSEVMEKYGNDREFLQKLGDEVCGAVAKGLGFPETKTEGADIPMTVETDIPNTVEIDIPITAETAPPRGTEVPEVDTFSSNTGTRQRTEEEKAAKRAKKKRVKAKQKAEKAFDQENYEVAVAAYTEAMECGHINDRTRADLLSGRGLCWLRMGQVEKASADLKACRELTPDALVRCFSDLLLI